MRVRLLRQSSMMASNYGYAVAESDLNLNFPKFGGEFFRISFVYK